MAAISEQEKFRRKSIIDSVTGTHAMEALFADAEKEKIFARYVSGELDSESFGVSMDTYARSLVAKLTTLSSVA